MYWELIGLLYTITLVQMKYVDEDNLIYWRRSSSPENPKCIPFSQFMIDCNKCLCDIEGTVFCTRMHCNGMKADGLRNVKEIASYTDRMATAYDYQLML